VIPISVVGQNAFKIQTAVPARHALIRNVLIHALAVVV